MMQTRVAVIAIVVENPDSAADVNRLLHEDSMKVVNKNQVNHMI